MPRGRPPQCDVARTRRVEFRVTPDEYGEIRRLSALNDATVGEWCRYAALQAAGEMGEDPQIIIGGRLMITSIIRR
ncbi:MAG: hypothetical protein IT180_10805 [Acidobacteria bacterium]|nr:hypothetical protein [Acidobacteriota bacterium]